jgi:hypothetical protein
MISEISNPSVRYEDDDSPEINWEKLTADNLYRCLEIGLDPKMNSDYQGRRYEFWKRIELLKGESFRSSA